MRAIIQQPKVEFALVFLDNDFSPLAFFIIFDNDSDLMTEGEDLHPFYSAPSCFIEKLQESFEKEKYIYYVGISIKLKVAVYCSAMVPLRQKAN